MSDERKKPPPRPNYPRPVEPFRHLTEPSQASHVEIGAAQKDIVTRLDEVLASHREILSRQRSMALQLDGYGNIVNQRFDVFHEELAMLRATVMEDHAPRLDKAEATLGQKAAKGGGIVAVVLLVLPMLAEALPKYRHLFEAVGGLFQ